MYTKSNIQTTDKKRGELSDDDWLIDCCKVVVRMHLRSCSGFKNGLILRLHCVVVVRINFQKIFVYMLLTNRERVSLGLG